MQQFIPFEDDWDALELLRPEALLPYRVGLSCVHRGEQPASFAVRSVPSIGSSLIDASAHADSLLVGLR